MASLTALGEMFWPSMFPWNLGYPLLWIKSPMAQTADHIGFNGLSYLMLLSSAMIAWLWLKKDKKLTIIGISGLGLTLTVLHLWGFYLKSQWSNPEQKIRILQVQANIGNLEKYYAEKGVGFQQEILNQYFQLTERQLGQTVTDGNKADLVIWPETAFPDYLNPHFLTRPYPAQFISFLRKIQTPILTGGYSKVFTPNGQQKNHNALFLYDGQGQQMSDPYNKTNLLVFGEYVPFGEIFPLLKKLNPGGEGWDKGSGPQIMNFGSIRLGPQICYESLYPEFSRKLSQMGAEILVNVTNDSWFGPTFEPYQHLYMTLARAIEMRRPLVRNTNTGITTAILADGTVLQQSKTFEPWAGSFDIVFQKDPDQTFFSRFGAWLPLFILLFMGFAIIIGSKKNGSTPS
ncbi:MAG: hypothetical protein BroJett040_24560 [Oligoflexia bacterium]|nr:MAG: hypothetical protein BroJett040_24560 [Oligoflexia bacterium]